MFLPVTRVGDIGVGVCPHHSSPEDYTTVFATGIADVTSNELSNCTTGSIGISSCGHNTVAMSGALDVTADELGIHRVGDIGMNYGPYVAVTGASDVIGD